MSEKRGKGIGLLSGGLDSMLAVRVLQEQKLELIGVTFVTPFFGPKQGLDAGRTLGIPVRLLDISSAHMDMLKAPVYGYGSQVNPCIDCHALMLREAGQLMEQEGGDFLFTGEVLGQRPMSQRRDSLRSVEKLSGYAGRVLRPLSARLLSPTIVEGEGLVDRERLLNIQGRSRKRQEALAAHYGIVDYPQPGGGCLLTKEGFARKLKALLSSFPGATPRQAEAIKWGRLFQLPGGSILVIGRNRGDNEKLESSAGEKDVLFRVADHPGPLGLLITSSDFQDDLTLAAGLILAYSDAPPARPASVEWRLGSNGGVLQLIKDEKGRFGKYQV